MLHCHSRWLLAFLLAQSTFGCGASSDEVSAEQSISVPSPGQSEPAVLPAGETNSSPRVPGCYWVELDKRIPWATSGVWAIDGSRLFVVNVGRSSQSGFASAPLLEISLLGEVTEHHSVIVSGTEGERRELMRVSQIRRVGDSFRLQENAKPAEFLVLDRRLTLRSVLPLEGRSLGAGLELVTVFDWYPVEGGILAYGDLRGVGGEPYVSDFVYLPESGEGLLLDRIDAASGLVRRIYTRNIHYIASIESNWFILDLDVVPELLRAEVTSSMKLSAMGPLPEDFQVSLKLEPQPAATGREEARRFYEVFEQSKTVASLYAWKSHLYLLAKEPKRESRTVWWLIKMDPLDEGREISRVRLPTTASHLTVIPGELWAFLEKGDVSAVANSGPYMNTGTMLVVPSSWIEESQNMPASMDYDQGCAEFRS